VAGHQDHDVGYWTHYSNTGERQAPAAVTMMQLRSARPNCAGVWRRIIFGVTGGSEAQTVFDRYPWCSAVEFAQ